MDVHSGWGESGIRSKLFVLTAHAQFEPGAERRCELCVCVFVYVRDNSTVALNIYTALL